MISQHYYQWVNQQAREREREININKQIFLLRNDGKFISRIWSRDAYDAC
jgi:hypothetical protein